MTESDDERTLVAAQWARALEQGGLPTTLRFGGLSIGVGRILELNRSVSDAEWDRLVADLRSTFDAPGVVLRDGAFRQWSNGNLRAIVEPTASGQRLRIQSIRGASRNLITAGATVLGIAAAALIGFVIGHAAFGTRDATGIGFIATVGLGMITIGAARVPGWARQRSEQFRELFARWTAVPNAPSADDPRRSGA